MSTNRALVIAATLMTLMTLAPPAYAGDSPVTADDCVRGGGVVYTDANGFRACDGGTFNGRFVV
ncbi:MAG: hypothetical protein ACRDZ4_14425 [Egibacteraceae bacterium]